MFFDPYHLTKDPVNVKRHLLYCVFEALKSFNESLKVIDETTKEKKSCQNKKEPLDLLVIGPILHKLSYLIGEDNVESENCLAELKKLIDRPGFSIELQKLEESIGNFDFEAAKEPLQKIANKIHIELRGN